MVAVTMLNLDYSKKSTKKGARLQPKTGAQE